MMDTPVIGALRRWTQKDLSRLQSEIQNSLVYMRLSLIKERKHVTSNEKLISKINLTRILWFQEAG